jgi:hypothetical protein
MDMQTRKFTFLLLPVPWKLNGVCKPFWSWLLLLPPLGTAGRARMQVNPAFSVSSNS